jgi:hypothetical protein
MILHLGKSLGTNDYRVNIFSSFCIARHYPGLEVVANRHMDSSCGVVLMVVADEIEAPVAVERILHFPTISGHQYGSCLEQSNYLWMDVVERETTP